VASPYHSGSSTPSHTGNVLQGSNHPLGGLIDIEEVKRTKDGRKYSIITREYMAQGHDGYDALKDQKYLIDDESGQVMSTIVRKYLLGQFEIILYTTYPNVKPVVGCRFVQRMSRMESQERIEQLLNAATHEVINREQARQQRYNTSSRRDIVSKWRHAAHLALRWSRAHYKDHIRVTETEHMSAVDCFDGDSMRGRKPHDDAEEEKLDVSEEDLITIHPVVDGRMKDVARD
jgi:5'-nucleotidase